MNKLIPLMALALLVLVGCAKEETIPTMADHQQVEESGAFVLSLEGDNPVWEYVTLEEPVTSSVSWRENEGNSGHMHGEIIYGGISMAVFSGTQNNGGAHGSATLNIRGRNFTLETECVMVEGNEAVYGGIITALDPGFPNFQVGDRAYFKVFDNGQGNNAPADQFWGGFRFSTSGSQCGIWTPGSTAWPELLFGFIPMILDIEEPGSVKVNN